MGAMQRWQPAGLRFAGEPGLHLQRLRDAIGWGTSDEAPRNRAHSLWLGLEKNLLLGQYFFSRLTWFVPPGSTSIAIYADDTALMVRRRWPPVWIAAHSAGAQSDPVTTRSNILNETVGATGPRLLGALALAGLDDALNEPPPLVHVWHWDNGSSTSSSSATRAPSTDAEALDDAMATESLADLAATGSAVGAPRWLALDDWPDASTPARPASSSRDSRAAISRECEESLTLRHDTYISVGCPCLKYISLSQNDIISVNMASLSHI